ncbi:hypothetical protein [Novosphingobium sp.]|uniref:hypothetical protein n=1 Tax=Novosphingobium sp. TaxID=1874826 RepID=UPI00286ACF74|nr:hypothetical protein [Novosphingobium sp.]
MFKDEADSGPNWGEANTLRLILEMVPDLKLKVELLKMTPTTIARFQLALRQAYDFATGCDPAMGMLVRRIKITRGDFRFWKAEWHSMPDANMIFAANSTEFFVAEFRGF